MAFRRLSEVVFRAGTSSAEIHVYKRLLYKALSTETSSHMTSLDIVVSKLKSFAPLSLAESWDNVGLLVEPSGPKFISKLMLTNDLTASVMEEAKDKTVDLILSYHPPIFVPMKRLTQNSWKERILIECIESRIAVFSPHTSYDAVENGVNDWLISAFDIDKDTLQPIEATQAFIKSNTHILEVDLEPSNVNDAWKAMTSCLSENCSVKKNEACYSTSVIRTGSKEFWRLRLECRQSELPDLMKGLMSCKVVEKYSVSPLSQAPQSKCGMGRKAQLNNPISLDKAIAHVKSHLGLEHVMVAKAEGSKDEDNNITTVAVCAGSGSSVLKNAKADLLLTGEMSHHQVLDAVHGGSSVILCNHSNTERGFLNELKGRLSKVLGTSVQIFVSECDRDPLDIV